MSFIYHYCFQYFWPNWPGINRYAVVSSALTMISAVLFSQKFLMTKTNAPSLHWISNLFLGVAVVIIFLLIFQISIPALLMAQAGILLMAIYFLVIGVVALRKGYTPAKFYLVAWGALILGFIAAILESLNLIPVTPYINSMQIGSAVEVTLLSFALADRINKYKKEREEAQALALQAAKEKNTLIAQQNIMLEKKVEERTTKIKETLKLVEIEKLKSEELLLNILPQSTANELKESGTAQPKHFESVTVIFFDIEKFTTLADKLHSEELVARLDDLFQHIDEIIERSSLEKIKTIGDAYMAAGGIPLTNDSHPIDAIKAAIEVMTYLEEKEPDSQGNKWQMRCGIHTGPVVAGVVGKNKFAYDIWGSTVNFASRMESSGEVGKINISEATYQLVKSQVPCTFRGAVEVKGLGKLNMYFVEYS
jgi:class 3 adenylate cyclase